MTAGRLIAVVGPSGVGKDSVMRGIKTAVPAVHLVRRVITRAPDLGGEDYDPATPDEFANLARKGAFAVQWDAHGLSYGIPFATLDPLAQGRDCLANFSRSALMAGAAAFGRFTVLNITADTRTLAKRLARRGRENVQDIENRLAQADKPLPDGLDVITISNDGPLAETVALAVAALQPVKA